MHTFLASPACKTVFLAEDLRKSTRAGGTKLQGLATCQLRWVGAVNLVSNYPCAKRIKSKIELITCANKFFAGRVKNFPAVSTAPMAAQRRQRPAREENRVAELLHTLCSLHCRETSEQHVPLTLFNAHQHSFLYRPHTHPLLSCSHNIRKVRGYHIIALFMTEY